MLLCAHSTFGTGKDTSAKLAIKAYGELYKAVDFSNFDVDRKAGYLYNHARQGELSANLLLVQADWTDSNARATLGLMAGDYTGFNLSSEPIWARSVYQASAGVKLSSSHQLWLDAGIFPSHLGSESPIGSECLTLTRSLSAEGSPYYEAGLNLNLTSCDEKLYVSFLILNGWQVIRRSPGQPRHSLGTQIKYTHKENYTFNYSTFLSWAIPGNRSHYRSFHDLFVKARPSEQIEWIAGFDIGFEQIPNRDRPAVWYSPLAILRYKVSDRWYVAARVENFYDEAELIVSNNLKEAVNLVGASVNVDYRINDKFLWRTEWRQIQLLRENSAQNRMSDVFTSSLCVQIP